MKQAATDVITTVVGTVEGLFALIGAMIFVWLRHKEHSKLARLSIVGASGMTGYSLAPDLASSVGWLGESTAMFVVCVGIYALIDTALAVLSDKDAFLEIVKARAGRK